MLNGYTVLWSHRLVGAGSPGCGLVFLMLKRIELVRVMGLKKKIFIYVGTGLGALMVLLTSLRYHLQQYLISFPQVEQAIFVAVLDSRGKVLWTEPNLAQQVSQSLADTTAVREVIEKGQVYTEAEKSLLTQGSHTLSILALIKDSQEVLRGILITDIPALPSNSGFSVFLHRRH